MNEKNKAINRAKYKTTFTPKKAASLPTPKASTLEDEDEQKQLSVVEQFKKVQQEQQTLMEKLKQKYK